jgi:hypothetical protein
VDDVDLLPGDRGQVDHPPGRLPLGARRLGQRVEGRAGLPLLREPVGEQVLHVAVHGVHVHHGAGVPGRLEDVEDLLVVDPEGALVGHEDLERGDAVVVDDPRDLGGDPIVPVDHRHVERVVVGGPLGLGLPELQRFQKRFPLGGDHEVDQPGRPAHDGGDRAALHVVDRHGPHEGERHVDVGIDPAGDQELVRAVDDLVARLGGEVLRDRGDPLALNPDVRAIDIARGDDLGIPDDDAHGRVPSFSISLSKVAPPRHPGVVSQSTGPTIQREVFA